MKAGVRNVPVACSIVVSAFCPVSTFRSIHLINTHRINIATLGHFAFDLTYSKQRVSIALAMPRTRSESVSVSCLAQERVLMPHWFFFPPSVIFRASEVPTRRKPLCIRTLSCIVSMPCYPSYSVSIDIWTLRLSIHFSSRRSWL